MKSPNKIRRLQAEQPPPISNAALGVLSMDSAAIEAKLAAAEAALRAAMAPPGALGLHPLVDARRLAYGIPDGAFNHIAMFDRVIVAQLPEVEGETVIKGGKIIAPEQVRKRLEREAPRGIIISAGLQALDALVSNGCGLGHIVRFIRNAPYRFAVDSVGGIEVKVMLLRAGDIVSSEDLYENVKAAKVRTEVRETTIDGVVVRSHLFIDEQGQSWNPSDPWIADDM